MQLSLAALRLYAVMVMTYLIYAFITSRLARSWDSISELVLLAPNSRRAEHLTNTSAGAETPHTFRKPVNVRVNGRGSLELVFMDGSAWQSATYVMVKLNEKY